MLEWNEFATLCDRLYRKLWLKNFDGVISVGRGGTVVGAILSAKLGTRLYPVFVLHRGTGKEKVTKIAELNGVLKLKRGNYLLVDDKSYTGQTFNLLKGALSHLNLETATLICQEDYRPDYYASEEEKKILLPYET